MADEKAGVVEGEAAQDPRDHLERSVSSLRRHIKTKCSRAMEAVRSGNEKTAIGELMTVSDKMLEVLEKICREAARTNARLSALEGSPADGGTEGAKS